jgi:hypothetical protein
MFVPKPYGKKPIQIKTTLTITLLVPIVPMPFVGGGQRGRSIFCRAAFSVLSFCSVEPVLDFSGCS